MADVKVEQFSAGNHPRRYQEEPSLSVYLNVIQIIVSITLIALAVMQGKGAGLSTMFGGDSSVYKTRRGVEKTVFNLTIILVVVFLL